MSFISEKFHVFKKMLGYRILFYNRPDISWRTFETAILIDKSNVEWALQSSKMELPLKID